MLNNTGLTKKEGSSSSDILATNSTYFNIGWRRGWSYWLLNRLWFRLRDGLLHRLFSYGQSKNRNNEQHNDHHGAEDIQEADQINLSPCGAS